MRGKSMILIVIALGCGLVASIGISKILDRQKGTSVADVATKKIYVTVRDVNISEVFDAEMIKLEEWPADKVPEDAAAKLDDIVGLAPNQRLYAGEVIRKAKLADPATAAGRSTFIPKGYRVQAVKVQSDSAVGNILTPGDHVDVQVYLRKGSSIPQSTTKTILEDVIVFAVNSETEKQIDNDGQKINAKTVSLLVKPNQLQTLLLASRLGQISLSLRHPDDDTETLADDGANIHELLSGGAEKVSDEDDPAPAPTPPAELTQANDARDGFAKFLENLSAENGAQPAQPDQLATSEFRMQMITPEGITTFSLIDDEEFSEAQVLNTDTSAVTGSLPPATGPDFSDVDPDGPPPADDTDNNDSDDSSADSDNDA